MNIYLASQLLNNNNILASLENEFGGIEQGKPNFAGDDTDYAEFNPPVWSDCENYETTSYIHSILRFLEENFYSELKVLNK
jgi:hypothetical protein